MLNTFPGFFLDLLDLSRGFLDGGLRKLFGAMFWRISLDASCLVAFAKLRA